MPGQREEGKENITAWIPASKGKTLRAIAKRAGIDDSALLGRLIDQELQREASRIPHQLWITASHRRYLLMLAAIFTVEWVALAIHPSDRGDWVLENLLVLAFVTVLVLTRKRLIFSNISYTMIFIFLCLHEVGAHYTYAEVPYDRWFQALTGHLFNELVGWQRNNFDRIVHFLYGFLLAYPIREVFLRVANVRGFWGYFLPLEFTMATSMMFELFEWGAATLFGGDLGAAYLGTQGDIWDAHKDMLVASLGAVLAMASTALINVRLRRDFAREWTESLRVKNSQPLGEVEIRRLRRK